MTISHAPDDSVHLGAPNRLCTLRAGHRRWLVLIYGRELRLVDNAQELRHLVQQGYVGAETPVYEVGAGPHTVGSIPELAHIALETPPSDVMGDLDLEPQILVEEPLDADTEQYEVPVSRWPGRAAFVAGLSLVCVAGYLLLGQHLGAPPPGALAARLSSAVRSVTSSVAPGQAATAATVAPTVAAPSPVTAATTPAVALPAALPAPAPSAAQPPPDSDPPLASASAAQRPSKPDQPRADRRHRSRGHRRHHGRS